VNTLAADATSRPSVYEDGGLVVYRASAVGGCSRALAAEKLGFNPLPFNESTLTIFREGHRHEDHVIEDLTEQGWRFSGQQDEVEVKVTPSVLIRGHLDAIGIPPNEDDRVVAEVKALGDSTFKLFVRKGIMAFPRYAVQLSIYMHAKAMPGAFVVKSRNSGGIVIVRFSEPPVEMKEIRAKVARAEAMARAGDLPGCDVESQWNCPFLYLHDETTGQVAKGEGDLDGEVDATTGAKLEALAEAYDSARERLKQAETVKTEARDRLVSAMAAADLKKATAGRFALSRSTRTQRRVDMDALRAFVDVQPFEKEVVSEVITVRDRMKAKVGKL
jgi:hypothetical protein